MAEIYWLEQGQTDLPESNNWLGAREMSVLNSLVFPKRRADWRLGRWTAKCAFARMHQIPLTPDVLAQMEISAAASGAPQLLLSTRTEPVTISISHCADWAICAIASPTTALGCDLEQIEPHSAAFVEDYFTPAEQELIARAPVQDHPRLATLLWSAKESTLKALQLGLRADTRSVQIQLSALATKGWSRLRAETAAQEAFQGWWREERGLIRTIVVAFADEGGSPRGTSSVCAPFPLTGRAWVNR